jgi:hypothetical protein
MQQKADWFASFAIPVLPETEPDSDEVPTHCSLYTMENNFASIFLSINRRLHGDIGNKPPLSLVI